MFLTVAGLAIVLAMAWNTWNAFRHGRVYMGRRTMKWLYKADDSRRFQINVIANLVVLLGGLWMNLVGLNIL